MYTEIINLPGIRARDIAILSSLNNTIITCNTQLQSYTFGIVASALHSFFLYDFCDVYLELIKPIISIRDENNLSIEQLEIAKQKKYAAQCTLYTCLEQFLRLLHPLMPFVTEELWQRLPNLTSMTTIPSIMISPYPQEYKEWNNNKILEDLELVKSCVHAARSLRTDYKIANHIKANFYYRTSNEDIIKALKAQEDDFCTLARGEIFQYLDNNTPNPNKNVCIKVINESLSLLVDLTGLIDIDAELIRLKKEKDRIQGQLEQYKQKMNAVGYSTKVPEAVQISNTEKINGLESELNATNSAITDFENMKL